MKTVFKLAICVVVLSIPAPAFSAPKGPAVEPQTEFEQEVNAVVRNKLHYKGGHIEVTPIVGFMPYDSTVASFSVGARGTWHISDHFGWEVLEVQKGFPGVTSYIRNLVDANTLPDVQVLKINMLLSTNLIFSPIYGKIRFFGSSVLHFDLFAVLGVGGAMRDIVSVGKANGAAPVLETVVGNGFDPMVTFGLGAKFFINNSIGLVLDMRDYLTFTPLYGKRAPKSNFSVHAGIAFLI